MNSKYNYLLIIGLGILFYIPFLGTTHLFDWDEINFAESAREMIVTKNYAIVQINYQPFWEKPPLFFWLQVLSMQVFDVFNPDGYFSPEFGARFPNAVVGIITLLVLYTIGKKLHNSKFGLLWVLGYVGSLTPHLYFKSGIIDPTFNLFIFLGIWFTSKIFNSSVANSNLPSLSENATFKSPHEKRKNVFLAGFFIGLAVLTKGPVGGLIWGITIFLFWGLNRFNIKWLSQKLKALLSIILWAVLIACLWFGLSIYQSGWSLFVEFIQYQIRLLTTGDAGHEQPFYYHFLVVLIGCFPMSIFAIKYLFKRQNLHNNKTGDDVVFRKLMFVLFWGVMILFTIVKTKIVHYSSMAWFPLSYMATMYVYELSENKKSWNRWLTFGLLFIGILLGIILTAVPLAGQYSNLITPYIKDPFAVQNLQAKVVWNGWERYIGIVFLIGVIIFVLKKKIIQIYIILALTILIYSALVIPKIEGYTQRTAISFYESLRGKDVYVEPLGFKSYAQLFYFQKPRPTKIFQENELLNTKKLDKPAYFIMKIDADSTLKAHPNLELIREENGFLFYRHR